MKQCTFWQCFRVVQSDGFLTGSQGILRGSIRRHGIGNTSKWAGRGVGLRSDGNQPEAPQEISGTLQEPFTDLQFAGRFGKCLVFFV